MVHKPSSQEEVELWVSQNIYLPSLKLMARCIDGRYKNDKDLPALALPGGDAGELALLFATANKFGFAIDIQKAYDTLVEVVGGETNLRFHTDSHVADGIVMRGCGHIKQMGLDLKAYDMLEEQLRFIKSQFEKVSQNNPNCQARLEGEHMEGAVLLVNGKYGIYPQLEGKQVFIFHKSLVDARHRILCKELVDQKAVTLPKDCDDEYLYESLSSVTEDHLLETAKRLAKGLPIYEVNIKDANTVQVENVGQIS